ncbi:unnamed protein product [Lymnaea stagnalis]|uniref:Uncharacterized protein n=1 Tax=Lymnaea stagnalis TaxID=6523 RepID=A0AAV2H1J7_LYMST
MNRSLRSVNEDALAYAPKLLDTGVAVVVIVFVNISYFVSLLSDVSCTAGGQCKLVPSGGRSLELARWSISFLLPTLWLLDGHFRNVCAVICGKICIGVTYN